MALTEERWRWLGVAALGTAASAAVPSMLHAGNPFAVCFFVVQAFGAYCLARRSVTHQVLGQGIAASLAASHAGVLLVVLRKPGLVTSPTVLVTLAALVALGSALPFWRSRIAQERFAPLAARPAFLAGAIGSVAIAARLPGAALREVAHGDFYFATTAMVLATMLVAQATAVVRMRGWGVFLATATGASCVIPALVLRAQGSWLSALAVLASACLVVPVLTARRSYGAARSRERIAERIELAAWDPLAENERAESNTAREAVAAVS